MEHSEKDLVQKAQAGDTRAFERLIKAYEPRIFNLLLRMAGGNRAEAHDLFQETFLSAWKNLRKFRAESAFSTWLYRIAVNAVLMKKRKRKLQTVSMDAPLETGEEERPREFGDWSTNPLASLENQELRQRMQQALEGLDEKYRTVLYLSDFQGLSNEEIGQVLKISLPNVKSRLHRARLYLRQRLSEYFKNP